MEKIKEEDFLQELSDFTSDLDNAVIFDKQVAGYNSKEFLVVLGGGYAVRHNGKIVYHTNQPYPVLQEYLKIDLLTATKLEGEK